MLSKADLQLPESRLGELLLSETAPIAGLRGRTRGSGATGGSSSSGP